MIVRRAKAAEEAKKEVELLQKKEGIEPAEWRKDEQNKFPKLLGHALIDMQAMTFFGAQVALLEGNYEDARVIFEKLLKDAAPVRRQDLLLRPEDICLRSACREEALSHWAVSLRHIHDDADACGCRLVAVKGWVVRRQCLQ